MLPRIMRTGKRVAIVFDKDFGRKIFGLTKDYHIWIIKSLANDHVVQEVLKSFKCGCKGSSIDLDLVSFEVTPGESIEESCLRIASDVEEHYNVYSELPAWSEIRVFGASMTPRLERVFGEFGAQQYTIVNDGFVCLR